VTGGYTHGEEVRCPLNEIDIFFDELLFDVDAVCKRTQDNVFHYKPPFLKPKLTASNFIFKI
jgi:hypothetical protein